MASDLTLKEKLSLNHLLGEKFHPLQPEMILASEFEVAAVGGMGAGKTFAMCIAALRHAIKYPGANVLLARLTHDDMRDTIKKFFFEIVRNKGLEALFVKPVSWDYREGTNLCRTTHGAEIRFSNLDRNLDRHKNFEYTFIGIDQLEEIEFAVYQILMYRCRSTACPPEERKMMSVANDEGDNWIRQRFLTFEPPHGLPNAKLGRRLIRGDSFRNPHLDDATRASYAAMPAELQKRWVWATMEAGSSRLLPPFRILEPFEIPKHWPRFFGIDPARSEGVTCAEWITVNPDKIAYRGVEPNGIHFYAEYWGDGRDVETHVQEIRAISGAHRLRGQVMDHTSWASSVKSRTTGGSLSVASLYQKAGLAVSPSTGDEWSRVMLYVEAGKRGLTVSKACPHLMAQGPQYRIKGQMGAFGQPLKVVSKAKFHSVDAGGYALSLVPANATGVEIRGLRNAIDIADGIDDGSQRHWEMENLNLPKRRGRESIVTAGIDEAEFWSEDHDDEPMNRMRQTEDLSF